MQVNYENYDLQRRAHSAALCFCPFAECSDSADFRQQVGLLKVRNHPRMLQYDRSQPITIDLDH